MPRFSAKFVFLAAISVAMPAFADMKGPAELPPASFKGQQYIDSKGCVFLRGGFGGQVTWVPRITKDRKQMCGYPPSGRRVTVAEEGAFVPTEQIAPPAVAQTATKSQPQPAPSVQKQSPAPKTVAAPPKAAEKAAPAVANTKMRVVCPPEAPLAKSFPLQGGGSQIMCTTDGANLATATPPSSGQIPQGFEPAWTDGRLNPYRGERTAQGRAEMEQLWSNSVPAEMHENFVVKTAVAPKVAPVAANNAAASGLRVQVGAFAQTANAEKTASRLAAMGYPVSRGKAKSGRLQVIYAGPFASNAEAQSALARLRTAGFGDAILRR